MTKRIVSLLLSLVLLLGTVAAVIPEAFAASNLKASEDCISLLKKMEGFLPKPVWDYEQYSVGYGCAVTGEEKTKYDKTPITESEADALLRKYVSVAEKKINQFAESNGRSFQQKEFDALILFTYNCGTTWLTEGDFKNIVIAGKYNNEFLSAIASWCKTKEGIDTGLLNRRLCEANVYINGAYSTAVPEDFCYVVYNAAGGECSVVIQAFYKDSPISVLPIPTRKGYKFLGWFTEPLGGTQISALSSSMNKGKVHAHWEKLTDDEKEESFKDISASACDTNVIVTSASTMLYKNSNTKSQAVQSAAKDTVLHIVATGKDSSNVEWGKTDSGYWVLLSDTEPNKEPEKAVDVQVTANYLNVRKGAGSGYEVTESLAKGKKVSVTEITKIEKTGEYWGKIAENKWICLTYTTYKSEEQKQEEQKKEEQKKEEASNATVKVTAGTLNIRKGAGTTNAVVGSLSKGSSTKVTNIKKVGSDYWGEISGKGWICLTYTDYKPATEEKKTEEKKEEEKKTSTTTSVKVTAGTLNIRKGAGTKNEIVGSLSRGNSAVLADVQKVGSEYWGEISGKGWICLTYTDYKPTGTEEKADSSETVSVTCKVTGSALNVRKSPGTTAPVNDSIQKGTTVTVTETANVGGTLWGKIGENKWICLSYTTYSSASSTAKKTDTEKKEEETSSDTSFPKSGYVTASLLNIRSDAGTSAKIVGTLSYKAAVSVTEIKTVSSTKWGKISSGWICLSYVKLDSSSESKKEESKKEESTDPADLLGKYQITASFVNIRKAPGLKSAVSDSIAKGNVVTVTETKTADGYTWGKYAEEKWICLAYAKKVS